MLVIILTVTSETPSCQKSPEPEKRTCSLKDFWGKKERWKNSNHLSYFITKTWLHKHLVWQTIHIFIKNDLQSDQTGEALEDVHIETTDAVVGQVPVEHRNKKFQVYFFRLSESTQPDSYNGLKDQQLGWDIKISREILIVSLEKLINRKTSLRLSVAGFLKKKVNRDRLRQRAQKFSWQVYNVQGDF